MAWLLSEPSEGWGCPGLRDTGKGRGVSREWWALLGLQRQEEATSLHAGLNSARRVEGKCFTIPFICTRLKSQMLGSLSGILVPCSQGMLRDVDGMGSCNASAEQGKGSLFAWGEDVKTAREAVRLGVSSQDSIVG